VGEVKNGPLGCQMAYSQTQNPILTVLAMGDIGIFYDHLVHFEAIWYILWPFGIFCGHLVYFVAVWYILWPFGIFCGHLVYFMVIWYIFSRWVSCTSVNLATLLVQRIRRPVKLVDRKRRR
jgi:hypothetical protein